MPYSDHHVHYPSKLRNSILNIDVRSKILSIFLIIAVGSLLVDFTQLQWFFLYIIVFSLLLQPRKIILKQFVQTLPIILSFTLVVFLTFNTSDTLFGNFLYSTHHNNVSMALFFSIRSFLMVLVILIFINSEESFFEVIYGLDDLKMPSLLTNLLFLTFRFFSLMQEEFSRVLEARSNRLYGEKLHLSFKSFQIIGNILGAALARSFKRSEYISATLAARGFNGKISHPEQPYTIFGGLFFLFTVIYCFFILMFGQTSIHTLFGGIL